MNISQKLHGRLGALKGMNWLAYFSFAMTSMTPKFDFSNQDFSVDDFNYLAFIPFRYIVSDCDAVYDMTNEPAYSKTLEDSVSDSILAGTE
jgi:hypothetical protein